MELINKVVADKFTDDLIAAIEGEFSQITDRMYAIRNSTECEEVKSAANEAIESLRTARMHVFRAYLWDRNYSL